MEAVISSLLVSTKIRSVISNNAHDLKIHHRLILKSKKLARLLCSYSGNSGISFLYLHDKGEKTERMEANDKGIREINNTMNRKLSSEPGSPSASVYTFHSINFNTIF